MADRSGVTGGGSGGPTSVGPDEGDAYWILGTLDTIKVPSELTEGRFAILESRDRQGDAPPLHVHEDADETYYVLEGEYTFFVGDESIRASVGRTVFAPRRIPHTYRAESAARHLWVISPAGFEAFFAEVGSPASDRGTPPPDEEPDLERLGLVAARYGVKIVGPPPV